MFTEKKAEKDKPKKKEEPSSVFQRQRVDDLLLELAKKFPPKIQSSPIPAAASVHLAAGSGAAVAGSQQAAATSLDHSHISKDFFALAMHQ